MEFLVGAAFALVLALIVSRAIANNKRKGLPDVCVNDWRKATYYPGKKGGTVPPTLAERIYKRDGWRCQYPGCHEFVYEGTANNFKEHLLGIIGAEPGNINHRWIPFSYGGPAIPENLEVMCQPHNIKRGKKIPRGALKWLAERGETIYLETKDLLR